MKDWRIVAVLLAGLMLASLSACGQTDENQYQLVEVVPGDLMVTVSGSGNIEVSNEAYLAFGIGGRIDKIYIEEGDEVSEGDVLAKLDTDALELASTQAKAAIDQAKAAIDQAKAAIDQAKAAIDQAKAAIDQAEYNLEKVEDPYSRDDIDSAEAAVDSAEDYLEYAQWMLDKAEKEEDVPEGSGIVPSEEQWTAEVSRAQANLIAAEVQLEAMLDAPDEGAVEAAESQLEAAESQFEVAESQLKAAESQLKAAESQLEATEQGVAQAQKQLDEATITAPFDGVVASVDADEGDSVSAVTTIIHLIDLTTMELNAEVDEIDIAEVKPGQGAIIEVDALPALQLDAEVVSISLLPKVEEGVVLYEVKIGFDVPEGCKLKVGMSATADIIIHGGSGVLLVPNRAIEQDSEGNSVVKVMVNEEIEERPVVTGMSDGYQTEIVDGLSEGEIVVVE